MWCGHPFKPQGQDRRVPIPLHLLYDKIQSPRVQRELAMLQTIAFKEDDIVAIRFALSGGHEVTRRSARRTTTED